MKVIREVCKVTINKQYCDECGKLFPLDELEEGLVENHDGDPDVELEPKWITQLFCKSCVDKMSFDEAEITEMEAFEAKDFRDATAQDRSSG